MFDATSPLCNSFHSPFYHKGIRFSTVDHFIEYQKAAFYKLHDKRKLVLTTKPPDEMKQVVDCLTHAQLDRWYAVVEKFVRHGIAQKLAQNPNVMATLKATKQAKLVYCNADDGFWGTGVDKHEAAQLDANMWPGKNRLGEVLADIRDKLV